MAPREFWRRAEENLQASRARLIYAASQVSTEMFATIELLNSQHRTIEAYAVRVSRARGGRVFGLTARRPQPRKTPSQVKPKAKRDPHQVLESAQVEAHLERFKGAQTRGWCSSRA